MGNSGRIGSEAGTKGKKHPKTTFHFPGKIILYEWCKLCSIKRFEATGQISLISLTKIAIALDIADELRSIFTQVPYKNIQEVINETK